MKMKILACILVALVFAFSFSLAEEGFNPSPSRPAMTASRVRRFADLSEKLPESMYIRPVNELYDELSPEVYERLMAEADTELEKLMDADKVTDYFGIVYLSSTGDQVPMIDLFDGQQPDIFEFEPIIAGGFDLGDGDVVVDMAFVTPYELGEQVAVLIGVVANELEDGQHVTWVAHRGVCVEIPEFPNADGIEVELRAEMVDIIQSRDTLLAVASQHHEAEQK